MDFVHRALELVIREERATRAKEGYNLDPDLRGVVGSVKVGQNQIGILNDQKFETGAVADHEGPTDPIILCTRGGRPDPQSLV